jgi:hypothetical protein
VEGALREVWRGARHRCVVTGGYLHPMPWWGILLIVWALLIVAVVFLGARLASKRGRR